MKETDYNQQAKDFLSKTQTEFKAKYVKYDCYFPYETDKRDIYQITLKRGNKVYSFNFGQAIAKSRDKRLKPTEYDVLACMAKSDPQSFSLFCADYGYDEDSRKAEKTYKAVCEEWLNVQRLWSDEEIEILQEIN